MPHLVQVEVEMFDRKRLCWVEAHGEPKTEYEKKRVLWVERGEDEYGIASMKKPFCVLRRQAWLDGSDIK